MEQWVRDIRFAARRLRRRPLFAALAVLTLALGVGGTAAAYAIVRSVLLTPLPYGDAAELVAFWDPYDWSQAEHLYLQEERPAGFADIAAYSRMELTYVGPDGGTPRSTQALLPSWNLFEVLGAAPRYGQVFGPDANAPGAEPVVVLSHEVFRELGGDPSLIGRPLHIGGEAHTIIGVMESGFWFPDPEVRLWVNSPFSPDNRSGNYVMVGRLAPGYTMANIGGPLEALAGRLAGRFDYNPDWDRSKNPELTPLYDSIMGQSRPVLIAVLGAMVLILMIACSNVAALMLGQVDGRSAEFALRASLGASRRQLLRQVLLETVVLGVGAGLAGAALAAASFRLLAANLSLGPMLEHARLGWGLFGAAMAIALGAAMLVAAVPALSLWRGDLRGSMTRLRTGRGARGGMLESGLVALEVALAVMLVAGAALLIRTVAGLRDIDDGMVTEEVAVVDIITEYTTPREERARMLTALVPALRVIPGVEEAAVTQKLPLRGSGNNWGFAVEGIEPGDVTTTAFRVVTPGYLSALGVPIRTGRDFADTDALSEEPVVIINEATRAEFFGDLDPIGRTVTTGYGGNARVIGVAGDVPEAGLTDGPTPARYMLASQVPYTALSQTIVLRVAPGRDPSGVLESARAVIEREMPIAAVHRMTTLERIFDESLGPALQMQAVLVMLGGLALLLGAIGVYGVVTHHVISRRREWSIRLALGQRPAQLLARIVRRGGALVLGGAVLGLVATLAAGRILSSFLYGVAPADGTALVAAALTLMAAGIIAALIPAWRAAHTDPAGALRES